MFPGFIQALTDRWLQEEYPDTDATDHPKGWNAERAATALHGWAAGLNDTDPMREFIDFFFHGVASYSLMRAAQRTNDLHGFLAARRMLLPLHAVSGSTKYVPLLITDCSNQEWVWPEGIRVWRQRHFTFAGVGYDFVMEDEIKKEKAVAAGTSFEEHQLASLFSTFTDKFREVLTVLQGMKFDTSDHVHPRYAGDVQAAAELFAGHFQVAGRRAGDNLVGRAQRAVPEADRPRRPPYLQFAGLLKTGKGELRDYATKFLGPDAAKPTLATAVVPRIKIDPQEYRKRAKAEEDFLLFEQLN